jgi:sulfate permease, SulP family
MPVGGSMSASRLNRSAGARSRLSLVLASVVMAVVILLFSAPVGHIAMPALAALLMLVGYRTVKPADLESVWRTGIVQKVVLVTTFAMTMLIPLQFAVLAGVGLSVVLHVVRQSNQITIKQWRFDEHGQLLEGEPPAELPHDGVVILQCYGSLFFASAPVVEARLPAATDASRNSVVLLRVRGRTDLGTTFMDLLLRYARSLAAHSCKLVIVSAGERVREQLIVTGVTDEIGPENVYASEERLGAALRRAHRDAEKWVERNASETGTGP